MRGCCGWLTTCVRLCCVASLLPFAYHATAATHPPAISVLLCAAICTSVSPRPVSLLVARSSMSSTELGAGVTPCGDAATA